MTDKDDFGDEFKELERAWDPKLESGLFVVRVDGKGFHNFTRGLERPYDPALQEAMDETMLALLGEIDGSLVGYTQSDEISVVAESLNDEMWFGGRVQKISSVCASIATEAFNDSFLHPRGSTALFDGRVHPVDSYEQADRYLDWRALDCRRNSINTLARQYASHTELHGKGMDERVKLLKDNGIDIFDRVDVGRVGDGFFYGRIGIRWPEEARVHYEDSSGTEHIIDVIRHPFKSMPAEEGFYGRTEREAQLRLERRNK